VDAARTKAARALALLFWATVVLAHGVGAVVAWALLPGGFPLAHARFFANRVFPALVVASALVVMVQALRRSRSVSALLFVYPCIWGGLALAAAIAFPDSGSGVALAAALFSLLFALPLALDRVLGWQRQARPAGLAWFVGGGSGVLGAALGAAFVLAQRAPEPSTHPFSTVAVSEAPNRRGFDRAELVTLSPWFSVDGGTARVTAQAGAVRIVLEPRLAFTSISPDRFWTVFSPWRPLPPLPLTRAAWAETRWVDSNGGSLRVDAPSNETAVIEARTWVEGPVYSHLNSYASLSVTGHRRLGLRFSPCPARVIEVIHAEYPFGAPARLAFLDARGSFRVVQASNAEKGPFTTLAEGPLARGEALSISLVELDGRSPSPRELSTIVFRDWSLQVSTELSPTAGWGLPQNAIEFGRIGAAAASGAYIDLSLAGTSVGRGWDSVGHVAGFYLNRMEIRVPAGGQ